MIACPSWTRPALAGLALLCARAAAARAQAAEFTPDSSPPRAVVMQGPVEVPLLQTPGARVQLPVVDVMVDGRGPYRFGIETGARFVGVAKSFADSLGLRRVGGPDETPQYAADSINLGAATFVGVPVGTLPAPARGVDGILGLPLYQDLLLTIDYPAGKLRLERDSLPAPDGRDVLPLRRAGEFWALAIAIAGKVVQSVLDTRSTGVFSVVPAVGDSLPFEAPPVVVGMARGAGIPLTEVRAGRLAGDVVIGRWTFPRPRLTIHAMPPGYPTEPLVGSTILQNFRVSLDQRHQRLRLTREGPATIELP